MRPYPPLLHLRRVGIGVDTDEQVEAFQCAFTFGHALNAELLGALGGLKVVLDSACGFAINR